MEDIRLPRHVIDRVEHRWANRLQTGPQDLEHDRSRPAHAHHVHTDGARVIPIVVKRARGGNGGGART
jgi:hypothetical protein